MKYLYKYPQAAYPVRRPGRDQPAPGPARVRVRAARHRRLRPRTATSTCSSSTPRRRPRTSWSGSPSTTAGPEPADAARPADALVPQHVVLGRRRADRPALRQVAAAGAIVAPSHPELGRALPRTARATPTLLFTENETNTQRLFGVPNRTPYVKDGINDYVVHGQHGRGESGEDRDQGRRPLPADGRGRGESPGDPAAALDDVAPDAGEPRRARAVRRTTSTRSCRRAGEEADEFYAAVIPPSLDADAANVMRQALAGMLWSKQFYHYDVDQWLEERGVRPVQADAARQPPRNDALAPHVQRRRHLDAGQVGVPVVRGLGPRLPRPGADAGRPGLRQAAARADAAASATCTRTARSRPTSGTSATSIRRSTPGPPSSPTAWRRRGTGEGDLDWLERCFQKLLLNSPGGSTARTAPGSNVFEGGFLGLDNIGVFDRSAPLPTGGYLEQADGTAWMALFCQNMLEIAVRAGAAPSRPTRTWR